MGRARRSAVPARLECVTAQSKIPRQCAYAELREAYRERPDSASEAESWSNCEEFEAETAVRLVDVLPVR